MSELKSGDKVKFVGRNDMSHYEYTGEFVGYDDSYVLIKFLGTYIKRERRHVRKVLPRAVLVDFYNGGEVYHYLENPELNLKAGDLVMLHDNYRGASPCYKVCRVVGFKDQSDKATIMIKGTVYREVNSE